MKMRFILIFFILFILFTLGVSAVQYHSSSPMRIGPIFADDYQPPDCYVHTYVGRICSDTGRYDGVYAPGRQNIIGERQPLITTSFSRGGSGFTKYVTAGKQAPHFYIQHERIGPRGPQVIKGNLGNRPIIKRQGYNTDLDVTFKGRFSN